MTAIYPYLTFENAKEAMSYYEQEFGAQVTYHEPLTKEQAENLGMPIDQLNQTTLRGEFLIAGQKIICADATMGNPQTSTLISILLDFENEEDKARDLFNRLANSESQRVTVPFGDWVLGNMMGQIVDRYGITWLISASKQG
ncbi:VOC family protein [uncultured Limosilactobacillus sp.]|uniref:VOC family protein n=1 Tax=uncultured Limosilactobacillus sp. TaxID=2837629 RepID=UPI00265E682C|nr:VOC family protein [uncultured Limosilactobacillus sp.]